MSAFAPRSEQGNPWASRVGLGVESEAVRAWGARRCRRHRSESSRQGRSSKTTVYRGAKGTL